MKRYSFFNRESKEILFLSLMTILFWVGHIVDFISHKHFSELGYIFLLIECPFFIIMTFLISNRVIYGYLLLLTTAITHLVSAVIYYEKVNYFFVILSLGTILLLCLRESRYAFDYQLLTTRELEFYGIDKTLSREEILDKIGRVKIPIYRNRYLNWAGVVVVSSMTLGIIMFLVFVLVYGVFFKS